MTPLPMRLSCWLLFVCVHTTTAITTTTTATTTTMATTTTTTTATTTTMATTTTTTMATTTTTTTSATTAATVCANFADKISAYVTAGGKTCSANSVRHSSIPTLAACQSLCATDPTCYFVLWSFNYAGYCYTGPECPTTQTRNHNLALYRKEPCTTSTTPQTTTTKSTATTTATTTTTATSSSTTTVDQTTKNGVAPSTNAICTVTTGSFSKPLRTWKPIEVDCPKKGGKPTVAMVTFNMGGVKGKIAAVQISMAASLKSGGASGLAVSMKKSTSTTPNTKGKLNNGLCSGALTSSKKVCDATSYNADGESKVVEYISVWNTGGCTGKVIVEASISEFKDGQKSSCLGKLAVLGGPRSGNADDLYCNIGSVSSCSTLVSYSDVLCGSIKAGYQCMAVKTISSTFLAGRCVANALTCEPKGAACATKPVGSESCQVCNSNDCFGDDVLNPVSEGGINKVAMSILAFAIAANLISP